MVDIIITHSLCKQYHPPKGPVAIRNVNLRVREGEVFSLLGPNGAGKTTLIALLCGLFPPTSGDATVAGYSVVQQPAMVKRQVGLVPEEVALYTHRSARQNLRYFGALYGLRGPELDKAIDEALSTVGLADRADERVATHSSGMRRRLNIAIGVVHRPRVVLMDEPTLGLDLESRRGILDLVLRLKRDFGCTVFYTTHYMQEAEEISDRVGIIHQGEIIALGTPRELIASIHAEDTVRLHTGAQAPQAAVDAIGRLDGVKRVVVECDSITLAVVGVASVLPHVLRVLDSWGVPVTALLVQQPTLETVFLHLTGRRLSETP